MKGFQESKKNKEDIQVHRQLIKNFNTTWIAGTPRTGSMWTSNIVREIFKLSGYKVKPEKFSKNDKDYIQIYSDKSIPEKSSTNRYVFKVHFGLKLNLPRSKYIINIRNPYEVCASFYKFMKCDLDNAIKVAKRHSDVVDYYKQMSKKNLLTIKFEDIESDAINTVKEIALFLQINLTEQNAELISSKFSKEKVKSIIKKCENDIDKRMKETGKVNENEIVHITSSNIRALDMDTGFQSGHVSGHLSREWRNMFSKLEIENIVDSIDDTAIKLGYESEKK